MGTQNLARTQELVRQLRDQLLVDLDHWTKGHLALDADFATIAPNHPAAHCWCLLGASLRLTADPLDNGDDSPERQQLVDHLEAAALAWPTSRARLRPHDIGISAIVRFNDHPKTTFADVRAFLDFAAQWAPEAVPDAA